MRCSFFGLPAPALFLLAPLSSAVLAHTLTSPATDGSAAPIRMDRPDQDRVDFVDDVQPILAQHCFVCHGPDEATREADLRLDLREHVVNPDNPFAPVVAGDSETSELIARILDADDPMPPVAHDDPLSDAQKQTLRRWVEEGADWPQHWSFVQPSAHDAPDVEDATWVRDPLDAFVLERLEAADLAPTEESTRTAWLRRVSFDLTGLPPTPAELDAFLADTTDTAYEDEVDRLLASSRYGERMAVDWLDLARYADTSGFQFDTTRTMWKWRDWVIEAFNENKPYDEFVVEQLAGDLLPNPSVDQLVATGFNRNHPTDSDSPAELDEYRTQYVLDRVHTTATTFMGLTVSCAQCHDHKYDPVSQEDFYSFYAFFNDVAERDIDFGSPRPHLRVPDPDQEPLYEDLLRRVDLLEARLEADDPLLDAAQREWESKVLRILGDPVEWSAVEPVGMLSHNGARLRLEEDGSIVAHGPTPVADTYDLVLAPGRRTVHALRLEVLPSDEADGFTGRDQNGQFSLTTFELYETNLNDGEAPELVYLAAAQADLTQQRDPYASEFDPQPGDLAGAIVYPSDDDDDDGGDRFRRRNGWRLVGDALGEAHEVVLIPLEPLELNDASILKVTLEQTDGTRSLIGRFRLSICEDERIRDQLLPFRPQLWSSLGPFPATSALSAFTTEFEFEDEIGDKPVARLAKYDQPVVERVRDEDSDAQDAGDELEGGPAKDGADDASTRTADRPAETGGPARAKPADATTADREPTKAPRADATRGTAQLFGAPLAMPAANARDAKRSKAADGAERPATDEPKDEPFTPKMKEEQRARDPRRLAWEEQGTWVDGRSATLTDEKPSAAWYLVRTIETTRARTATLRLDGPEGVRVWLNGEEVFADAPKPPAAPDRGDAGGSTPDGDDDDDGDDGDDGDFDEDDFDFEAFFGGGDSAAKGDRTIRLGFRAGTNELVVKVVYQAPPKREGRGGGMGGNFGGGVMFFGPGGGRGRGGSSGASLTFDVTPEGDDVIDHEIATALRRGIPSGKLARAEIGPLGMALPDEDAWNEHRDEPLAPKGIPLADRERSTDEQRAKNVRRHYRETVSTIGRALERERERLEGELKTLERKMPETMVMADRDEPRDTHIFMRGDWRKPGKLVSARVPTILPPLPRAAPKNRLGLARWLVNGEHPLTARVAVNRVWQLHFGTGFVSTPDDFGIRGALPSHPELLDTLAVDFVQSGWDRKALQRRIVLSATYRQSTVVDAARLEADPDNLLLSRGPRQRLDAEMVRNNALSVSGLLVEELGGPSVKPYQAPGLWQEISGGQRYRKDSGPKQYRRSLYVYWKRRAPYASMLTFDAAKGEICTVVRPQTNTPLQALVLLNNPVYVEAAKMLGQRMLKSAEDDAARLVLGFRLCTSRTPTEFELGILTALLADQRAAFADERERAEAFLSIGDAEVDDEHEPTELAAWAAVANALLNLDATINRG